jgi:hypothetical protein
VYCAVNVYGLSFRVNGNPSCRCPLPVFTGTSSAGMASVNEYLNGVVVTKVK